MTNHYTNCISCGVKQDKGLLRGMCRKCYNRIYYKRYREEHRQSYDKYHKKYYEKNKFRFNKIKRNSQYLTNTYESIDLSSFLIGECHIGD